MDAIEPVGKKIRLLIVEDHPTVRSGIRVLLREAAEIEVVGEAGDGGQALELAAQLLPDLILLDLELPVLRGDAVMRRVRQAHPGMGVLVLSSHNDPEYVRSMVAGGALGYLLKEDAPDSLVKAIRGVMADRTHAWLSPRVEQKELPPQLLEQTLTWREIAILEHLVGGLATREMAEAMGLTEKQVNAHLRILMQKFEAGSLEMLVEAARLMLARRA